MILPLTYFFDIEVRGLCDVGRVLTGIGSWKISSYNSKYNLIFYSKFWLVSQLTPQVGS